MSAFLNIAVDQGCFISYPTFKNTYFVSGSDPNKNRFKIYSLAGLQEGFPWAVGRYSALSVELPIRFLSRKGLTRFFWIWVRTQFLIWTDPEYTTILYITYVRLIFLG